jgi:hypothetical protein
MNRYKELQIKYAIKTSEPISEWIKRVAAGENLSIRTIQRAVKEGSNIPVDYLERQLSPIEEHKLASNSAFKKSTGNMWIVISDVHIPAEDPELMQNLFKMMEDYKDQIKGFVIAGDFLDCYGFSTHSINQVQPEGYSMDLEYSVGNAYLNKIDSILPKNTQKVFINGNHEARYEKYFKNVNTSVLKVIPYSLIGKKTALI